MRLKVCLGIALLFVSAVGFAQEPQQKPPSNAEMAMMDAMMKAATPGDAHQRLNDFVGRFNVKATMWMAPGAPPMVSEGIAETRWVLGDRYLEQHFNGTMMGAPFEGLGYTGYDNVKKQYWSTWMDSMSTGIAISTGKSADGKSWMYSGPMVDPMTGKDVMVEQKVTIVNADRHIMEMWGPGPDGKKMKQMELVFSRTPTEF